MAYNFAFINFLPQTQAKTIIYDLAATITDEGFDAMESTNIGFLWNPLARIFSPLW